MPIGQPVSAAYPNPYTWQMTQAWQQAASRYRP